MRNGVVAYLFFFALLAGATLSAQEPATRTSPSSEPQSDDSALLEVPAPPVVIEGELPHLWPTPEEMLQHFRDALKGPPSFLSSERQLANGTLEATNRFGRFCSPPLPVAPGSGVGGDIRLFARCAAF
jgi:hypothetical protein